MNPMDVYPKVLCKLIINTRCLHRNYYVCSLLTGSGRTLPANLPYKSGQDFFFILCFSHMYCIISFPLLIMRLMHDMSLLSFWLKIDQSLKIKCSQKLSMSCCCPTQGQFKTCFGIFITLHFFDL